MYKRKTIKNHDLNLNSILEFNIYGRQPVLEALKVGDVVHKIWIASDISGKSIRQIQNLADVKKISIKTVSKNDLQKFVGPVVHQGIAAKVSFNPFLSNPQLDGLIDSKSNPFFVILDQVQDPHNLGAILRTAEITGVDVVVLSAKGSAPINATVAKTSAGALFGIKLHLTENILPLIDRLKNRGIQVLAATVNAKKHIYETDFKGPTAMIVGSEGIGIRKNLLPFCDKEVTIPQMGKINSLNASVSTSVILYEALRQRFYDDWLKQKNGN